MARDLRGLRLAGLAAGRIRLSPRLAKFGPKILASFYPENLADNFNLHFTRPIQPKNPFYVLPYIFPNQFPNRFYPAI